MQLATRNGGQCAFCAFRSSEWLAPFIGRLNGARSYSMNISRCLSGSKKDKKESKSRYADRTQNNPRLSRSTRRFEKDEDHEFSGRSRSRDKGRLPRTLERVMADRRKLPNPIEIRSGVRRLMKRDETTIGVFTKLLLEQVALLENKLMHKDHAQVKSWGIHSDRDLHAKLEAFRQKLKQSCKMAEKGQVSKKDNPLFFRLRHAFVSGNLTILGLETKYTFINSVVNTRFNESEITNQEKIADMRNPLDWYPATRALQREIHLHVGPTNSGKTYHALKRLEAAESGIYAGPLRLLAHEVYTRFNAKGKLCALVTGEERRIPDGMKHVMNSCTVEMVPLNAKVDVAVIDEIQMMADTERGWAWTQAFLGIQAKEVHLCGELRTIELVTNLCKAMGDKLIIHKYERLSPLKSMDKSLQGDLRNLQKGDAIILFSRLAIHAMKADIEKVTKKRCAVVYGSLPPETRAQQAALFNDPNNDYDFLVASDAVGMGLNLSIKRIIFEATSKHDGTSHRLIGTSDIKQIAGRAGRYKTASEAIQKDPADLTDGKEAIQLDLVARPAPNVGYVTTLENFDLPIVREAMRTEVEPLKTAGIFPPSTIILRFASYFPRGTPFSYIVLRLHEIASINPHFHMCILREQIDVADMIEQYDLSPIDRIIFMAAPVAIRDAGFPAIVKEMASCVARQSGGEFLDLKTLDLDLLDMDIHDHPLGSKGYLRAAETLHKAITLYLWLSYRFAGIFRSQALAFHVKGLAEAKIDECLMQVSWDASERRQRTMMRQKALEKQLKDMDRREKSSGEEKAVIEQRVEVETIANEDGSTERAYEAEGATLISSEDGTLTPEESLEWQATETGGTEDEPTGSRPTLALEGTIPILSESEKLKSSTISPWSG